MPRAVPRVGPSCTKAVKWELHLKTATLTIVYYISKNELFLHNEEGGREFESYYLCIHRQQISNPSIVT